ncbi:MAG: 2-amino-4-hydroxy-6-hydroxymethyldihydropteridine diphosphokinase [Betaproteobacteria bacterium]
MATAYVGIGSNLGEPRRQIESALGEIGSLPGTRLARCSSFYRSAPLGHAGQPDFLNAVARLETTIAAEPLLDELQGIERRHGRERSFANAPRTLDLDLLLYDGRVLDSPRLTLPHPRMHERAFVLAPLAEIEPDAAVPDRGPVRELLALCARQRIERID